MALSTPVGYSASDLVFEETFNAPLSAAWHTYITSNAAKGFPWNDDGSGGSGMGSTNNAEYMRPGQVSVNGGNLQLTAIHQSVVGKDGGATHTFPYTSGAVSTYGNFEFNGGYLQISMKAPSGNGAWPGLWLLPGAGAGTSGDNFELDIQEGGFTEAAGPVNNNFTWHLNGPSGWKGGSINTGSDLTAAFHTYAIEWVPGTSIKWFLDGVQMAMLTSADAVIPNEPMHLLISMSVANAGGSGWHTVNDATTPASMQMLVDGVQYYKKAAINTVPIGVAVNCKTGTWTGTAPIAFSYQWKVAGMNVGTNSSAYTPVATDAGKTLTCTVTAKNSAGSASITSNALTIGAAAAPPATPPVNTAAPVIG